MVRARSSRATCVSLKSACGTGGGLPVPGACAERESDMRAGAVVARARAVREGACV